MVRVYGVVFIVITLIVITSPILYKIWIGDKVEIPLLLTITIAIYTLVHCWDSLQIILINGVGCVKLQTYVILIGLILHIPLSLLIGKYIGIYGVIASKTLITAIYACFFTKQIRKIIKQEATGIWIK